MKNGSTNGRIRLSKLPGEPFQIIIRFSLKLLCRIGVRYHWIKHPLYNSFVEEKWRSFNIQGWGGYRLKEKLKKLKSELKIWKDEFIGNLDKIQLKQKKGKLSSGMQLMMFLGLMKRKQRHELRQ